MNVEAVKPGRAWPVMRDVAADARGRHDDAVAGLRGRHEGVKIRHGAGGHADFRNFAPKTSAASSAAITSIFSIASRPISYLSPG